MRRRWMIGLMTTGVLAIGLSSGLMVGTVSAAKKDGPMLAHMVYFSLKDPSDANKDALVQSCHKHLTGHEGTVFYAAGTLAEDLNRDVNQRDFDVALQLVFDGLGAHDVYQTHPRHLDFIKENQPKLKSVRVFDAYVTKE